MAPPEPSFWQRIRQRKLVQWALAYLAAAWVALQLFTILGGIFDWPEFLQRVLALLLATGLPVALVMGWYHGEQGRQRVSTGEILILTALLLLAGVGLTVLGERGVLGPPPAAPVETVGEESPAARRTAAEGSIAVLPFANFSAEAEDQYFSYGLTEEIINALSRIEELRVAARTSSFYFADQSMPLPRIAAELGVAYVMEGSVRRSGERVRVTAQLINAEDGYHLWSETWDRTLEDSLAIQSDIADSVANAMKLELTGTPRRALDGGTGNTEAREAFYRGLYIYNDHDRFRDNYQRALQLFRSAVRLDPEYALARATLANALQHAASRGLLEPGAIVGEARAQLERAMELAPDLAEAHIARGNLAMLELDWSSVDASMRRAVASNPNSPRAHAALSIAATYLGRWDEALYHSRVAAQLDPVGLFSLDNYVEMLNILGRSGEAIAELEEALALNPQLRSLYFVLARSYLLDGQPERGLETARRYRDLAPGVESTLALALAQASTGDAFPARTLLDEIAPPRDDDLVFWVMIMAALGDEDRGRELTLRAVERTPLKFALYAYLPELDPFRDDAWFREALGRLNIPDPDPPER